MAVGAALTLALFAAACGAAPATPTPPRITFGFQVLVDLGLFDGFPNVPPPYMHRDLPDGTSIVVVDRGGVQQMRHVERDGERWRSLGGFDRPVLPDGPGPLLAAVPVGPDDGSDEELLLLVGRFPDGPINQLELTINGAAETVAVEKPITVHPFPAGTDVGPTYTTLDAATKRLGVEPVLAWFGGVTVDLRSATPAPGAVLEVQCTFGGVMITVPPDWRIDARTTAIAGGIDVQPPASDAADGPTLEIRATCVFGGVAIKR